MIERIQIDGKEKINFIGCWKSNTDELMEELIKNFEINKDKHDIGVAGYGDVDINKKNSTDLTILPKDINDKGNKCFIDYFELLNECYHDYLECWPFIKGRWNDMYVGPFNIQKYHIGGHYNTWHTEKENLATSHRALAWMTYLNDVEDGGYTDFLHFDLSIKPEKGKTIIWPAEWTHAHKGNPVNSEKYIITGWFHFPKPEKD